MKGDVLIRVSAATHDPGVCSGCKRPIVWMDTLNGKRMPMNQYAMPRHVDDGVEVYAASDSHWATCRAKKEFDRRDRTNA